MSQPHGFFQVQPVATALAQLLAAVPPLSEHEWMATEKSYGRVLAAAPHSPMDLPAFVRSTMDGFAVRATDTFGASDSLPAYLKLVGQVEMGVVPTFTLHKGETAVIHTGAMLPDGADAVVMMERTQQFNDTEIEILAAVAPGENLVQIGEDIRRQSEALPIGHTIRPQDIGGLLAVGIHTVEVMRRPRVSILSCGDELVSATAEITLGQVRDINAPMLAALCAEAGADVTQAGISSDDFETLLSMAQQQLADSDLLVMSAGSSVSARDLTSAVIAQLGQPGILQHGLAIKPGKPTILAACAGKAVIGLPGNPVSAVIVARQVVLPVIRHLTGENQRAVAYVQAVLQQNIASTSGREDTVPVQLVYKGDTLQAVPIFGKSNLIYTLLKADGLVHVPLNTGGYKAGSEVEVVLF